MLVAPETISLTGRLWHMRQADERLVQAFIQQHALPEILARILTIRDVALDEAEHFLNPSLKNALPDPGHLLDMQAAAERVATAVTTGERIAIFGDYDVDGATSSALLIRYLRALGSDPIAYIPDRMSEGYGPNEAALLGLKKRGVALVITVDCGTLAHAQATLVTAASKVVAGSASVTISDTGSVAAADLAALDAAREQSPRIAASAVDRPAT